MIYLYQTKFQYLTDRQKRKHKMVYCIITYNRSGKYKSPDALHHYLVHDTKINRRRYPLLLDSLMNLLPVVNAYHIWNSSWGKISEFQADKVETFLFNHPKAHRFVNHLEPIKYFRGEEVNGRRNL